MKYSNYLSTLSLSPISVSGFENHPRFKITHDYFIHWSVYLLLSGELRYSFEGGGEHRLRAGELLIVPPFYTLDKDAVSPSTGYFMTYSGGQDVKPTALGNLALDINDRIREDLNLAAEYGLDSAYCRTLQMDIWHQICALYSDPIVTIPAPDRQPTFISLLNYIEEHLGSRLTLDDLAAFSGYSKSALISLFKERTKTTPLQYITTCRVDKVKCLLCGTRMTIREIASLCGFANEFYLSTVFHKYTGMTPSDFRRNYN